MITVQPGDVVGFYTKYSGEEFELEDLGNSHLFNGLQLDENSDQESVWYRIWLGLGQIDPAPDHTCQLTVGNSGTLSSFTELAPVLSIDIGK